MRIVTPAEVPDDAKQVSRRPRRRQIRALRERFPARSVGGLEEKLTTRAFDELVRGGLKYRWCGGGAARRRPDARGWPHPPRRAWRGTTSTVTPGLGQPPGQVHLL